ncbi:MAG: hypothetical protein ACOCRK_09980 [bacterium]
MTMKKLRELYIKVRKNPKKVNEVIKEIEDIIREFKQQEIKYSRLLSFISLKNDLILQNNLTEENVDSYVEDLKYCINNKIYLAEGATRETPFKIFEMIAKIQYAYNLLDPNKSIRNIYEEFLEEYNRDFDHYFKLFKGKRIEYKNYQLIFIYSIYYLFINEYYDDGTPEPTKKTMENLAKTDFFYRKISYNMMMYLKERKIEYYKPFKLLRNKEFKNLTKYDFIYRETLTYGICRRIKKRVWRIYYRIKTGFWPENELTDLKSVKKEIYKRGKKNHHKVPHGG